MTDNLGQQDKRAKQRSPNHGGWRGSDKSLQALADNRARTQFGGPAVRLCKHCNGPAVRGATVCLKHGGFFALHRQGRIKPSFRTNRQLKKLQALGQIPQGLVEHPAWIACRARGYRAALLARELWQAWDAGGLAWVAALRKVKEAGLI